MPIIIQSSSMSRGTFIPSTKHILADLPGSDCPMTVMLLSGRPFSGVSLAALFTRSGLWHYSILTSSYSDDSLVGAVRISDREQTLMDLSTARDQENNDYFIVPQVFHDVHCLVSRSDKDQRRRPPR